MISPGYWVQKFLETTIQVNPVQDVSGDLRVNISALLTTWDGNASHAAFQYFNGLGLQVDGYRQGLATLRDKYNEAAKGVWEFSESINDIIQSIFWGSVAAIAGGILAETVVGPALLWSLAALECKNIVDSWKQATNLLMNIQNAIRIIHGGILDVIGSNGSFTAHPLPAGYDHPGA